MLAPPSLAEAVKARAFIATNGELGISLADVEAFLNACRADSAEMLGWELWIVDHAWGPDNGLVRAPGLWCGGIPLRRHSIPAVVGGSGDLDQTAGQLASFDFRAEIQPGWLPYVRVNFTLGD
ncbi:MAG: hypothetical protein K0R83_871 [Caulobacter sp.]|jgi:hypothetical protein|nr:hypothetical protein [Caulobacter sp.]